MKDLEKNELFKNISALIEQSRLHIAKSVNTAMVYTYYGVGRYIVEYEQEGKDRAEYGKALLENISEMLTAKFGNGWSVANLRAMRQFYVSYSKTLTSGQQITKQNNDQRSANSDNIVFNLPWTHYQILMRIENPLERNFYEVEATNGQWSKRYLQRQVASSLFERVALSRNKEEVIKLATQGQTIEKPDDIIKNPLVLEFCGLKPDESYNETKLENSLISKIQQFLMEMGKGFLFEARQKRFTFEEDNFFVDLVLYNRILQCYVLVDLKTDKLTHQDLGQMQMYVNYFDRYVKLDFEKPTIGILLCRTKNDALVELTLPKDANIYAQQYALCLPNKQLLQNKLQQWSNEFETNTETRELL